MTKIAMIIGLAVALSGCAAFGQSGNAGASSTASVGVTGTASDAMSNIPSTLNGGSTSTSMEEQRIKQHNGGTWPTSYVNETHLPS